MAGYEDQEEDACKTRIHTSVSVYHTYKDKCEKTRNGTLKRKRKIYLRKTRRRKVGEKEERRPRVSVQTGTSTISLCSYLQQFELV